MNTVFIQVWSLERWIHYECCWALKIKNETPEMCCVSGKLTELRSKPKPLSILVSGDQIQLKHFSANIRKYTTSIKCQYTKSKSKFIIAQDQCYQYRMQVQYSFKFISWEILINKSINRNELWRPICQLQHEASAEYYTKQLLDIGNRKMAIDNFIQCITLLTNFCKITATIDKLIHKVHML